MPAATRWTASCGEARRLVSRGVPALPALAVTRQQQRPSSPGAAPPSLCGKSGGPACSRACRCLPRWPPRCPQGRQGARAQQARSVALPQRAQLPAPMNLKKCQRARAFSAGWRAREGRRRPRRGPSRATIGACASPGWSRVVDHAPRPPRGRAITASALDGAVPVAIGARPSPCPSAHLTAHLTAPAYTVPGVCLTGQHSRRRRPYGLWRNAGCDLRSSSHPNLQRVTIRVRAPSRMSILASLTL